MKNIILALICVLVFATTVSARPSEFAPLGETYSFDSTVIRKTYLTVAEAMNEKIDSDIPIPTVVISTTVSVRDVKRYIWSEFDTNTLNYYVWQKNTIMLMPGSEIHNLAHELVHHFQFNYTLKMGFIVISYDTELRATMIQNLFRNGGIYEP